MKEKTQDREPTYYSKLQLTQGSDVNVVYMYLCILYVYKSEEKCY